MSLKINKLTTKSYFINDNDDLVKIINDFGFSGIYVSTWDNPSDMVDIRTLGRDKYVNFMRCVDGLAQSGHLRHGYSPNYDYTKGPILSQDMIFKYNTIAAYWVKDIPLTPKELHKFYWDSDGVHARWANVLDNQLFVLPEGITDLTGFSTSISDMFGKFETGQHKVTHIQLNKKTLAPFMFDEGFEDIVDIYGDMFSKTNPILGVLYGAIMLHNPDLPTGYVKLQSSANPKTDISLYQNE